MGLAFWRRKKTSADAAAKRSSRGTAQAAPAWYDDDNGRSDPGAALRVRARRRLIGAAALLLTVAVVVPMLLDPAPRPVSDNIAIDIPSEKTPFAPRLSLPSVPAPESVPLAPPADAPGAPETSSKAVESAAKAADKGRAAASKEEEQRARTLLDGKSVGAGAGAAAGGVASAGTASAPASAANASGAAKDSKESKETSSAAAETLPAVVKGGKFAVQVAAPASEAAARELADRLRKSGYAPYMERTETKDGVRFRVRVGPYATRDDADKVRVRLKALGVSANIVTA